MATIISSKTTGGGGLAVSGDSSGILQLASADGTTAVTIDASQVATFTNAPVMGVTGLTGNIDAARITTALNATGTAPIYACRAWVNFNGTGTVAIRASGNVSSITDNGVGNYTVNFSSALADANYAANISYGSFGTTSVLIFMAVSQTSNTAGASLKSTSQLKIVCSNGSGVAYDNAEVYVSILR